MNKLLNIVICILAGIALVLFFRSPVSLTGAPPGLESTLATSTRFTVTGAVLTLVASSTNCSSRVITTGANAINLSFSDIQGDRLTGFNGHWQAASTTVSYDGGLYGCGLIRVRGDGTSLITISQFN